ncbi:hypothetical protein ACJHYY_25655 [Escherichia sp. WS3202]|uniref:hypothetical protein n=1 Tax=Escherichia sp. WS3202 TaxID=3381981 RepID=UPI00216132C5|nr:hypothetical protein [Escherichia coli]
MKFQDGSVINGEGDRQESRFVVCRSGCCGDISRELPAEMPESFMVDAVEAGIRGLAHSTGEPVECAGAAAPGHFFRHHFSLQQQVRKRLNSGVDHDEQQCEFTGTIQISARKAG